MGEKKTCFYLWLSLSPLVEWISHLKNSVPKLSFHKKNLEEVLEMRGAWDWSDDVSCKNVNTLQPVSYVLSAIFSSVLGYVHSSQSSVLHHTILRLFFGNSE
ncbi:hypothetical protein VNO80_14897 [Phaseolus coccineus]|uniref:Uncharacterized protein n=1 Tax=Phaseolus coccineus TaxID=3886 RepID=A0AAN9R1B4_PHACN